MKGNKGFERKYRTKVVTLLSGHLLIMPADVEITSEFDEKVSDFIDTLGLITDQKVYRVFLNKVANTSGNNNAKLFDFKFQFDREKPVQG